MGAPTDRTLGLPEVEATTAVYDEVAASYAAQWAGQDTVMAPLAPFAAALRPGALVLDLGCGPGRDLRWLAGHGVRAVGLDRSGGMLAQARRLGPGPLVQGDMARLPFRDGVAGGLWLCGSFLHVPKRAAGTVLAELARVLSPGGLLGLVVREGSGEGWTDTRGHRFYAWWRGAELDAALAGAGLRVLEARTEPDGRGREPWLWRLATR